MIVPFWLQNTVRKLLLFFISEILGPFPDNSGYGKDTSVFDTDKERKPFPVFHPLCSGKGKLVGSTVAPKCYNLCSS